MDGLVRRLVGTEPHIAVRTEDLALAELRAELVEQLVHGFAHALVVHGLVLLPVGLGVVRLQPLEELDRLDRPAPERHVRRLDTGGGACVRETDQRLASGGGTLGVSAQGGVVRPAASRSSSGNRHHPADPPHRRADDGEPLVRQLPRRCSAAAMGLPLGADGQPPATNLSTAGQTVAAHRLTTTSTTARCPDPDLGGRHEQWADGRNDGFVRSAERGGATSDPAVAMGYWTEESTCPSTTGWPGCFRVADRWFSSCLGPTFPNRRFLVAGTANGLIDDDLSHYVDRPDNGTLFDLLAAHRISWVNYHPIPHLGPAAKRAARRARPPRRTSPRRHRQAARRRPPQRRGRRQVGAAVHR